MAHNSNSSSSSDQRFRVGIVGAGEVCQVVHLPTLSLLSHLFEVQIISDLSAKTAQHCAAKFNIPSHTANVLDVFSSPVVDVVFILTSDEWHEPYTIAALEAGKHVMVEKPLSLSVPSVERIIAAEAKANGPRVFVGYMRRYAKSYLDFFFRELATIPRILYARSRDFSGPNAKFVYESGAFPVKHTDFPASAGQDRDARLQTLLQEAFPHQSLTQEKIKYCRFLNTLGSHDISLLRDCLGFPESVTAVSVNDPFYTAVLNYRNKSDGSPFSVTYESGVDAVPDFDAHLAIYGEKKRITVRYDTPFVKGLPIKVIVQELNEFGDVQVRETLQYEDAYTSELQELHQCLRHGKEIKTSTTDALEDLKIFDMMYAQWRKQEVLNA